MQCCFFECIYFMFSISNLGWQLYEPISRSISGLLTSSVQRSVQSTPERGWRRTERSLIQPCSRSSARLRAPSLPRLNPPPVSVAPRGPSAAPRCCPRSPRGCAPSLGLRRPPVPHTAPPVPSLCLQRGDTVHSAQTQPRLLSLERLPCRMFS